MKPVLLSLPFVGHRHGPRAYGYPPQMEQVPLPFPAEAARGRGHKNAVTDGDRVLDDEGAPTLASLGVSKRESSEAQKLADLEPEKFDEVLKKTRGERWRSDLGDWYIVNFNSNSLVCGRIDPIDEARERGVLKPYEEVVDVDDEEEVDHVE